MSDQWKKEKVTQTFDAFLGQFGNPDEYSRLVLEIIFEEIYVGAKIIPLSDEKGQKGDEINMRFPNE